MHLPGRLRLTTVGDLLGALHRAQATGTLELVEDRGRAHRVHVAAGLVVAAEYDGAGASLAEMLRRDRVVDDDTLRRSLLRAMASRRLHGEVLVRDFALAPSIVDAALRRQTLARLALIDQIPDARVHFRVAVRPPRGALTDTPLEPRDFLFGRRRARPRDGSRPPDETRATSRPAWRVLGIPPGAHADEIKRAFRRLVRAYHPDLHPGATAAERRELEERFAEVTAAYRSLVA
jgi:DnaJ-domain-containing protein 1